MVSQFFFFVKQGQVVMRTLKVKSSFFQPISFFIF